MGSGFSKMKKQAKLLQQQYEEMQEKMQTLRIKGAAPNDLVTVTIDGDKNIKDLKIKPECVDSEDIEALQDLIITAYQEAVKELDKQTPDNKMPMMPF